MHQYFIKCSTSNNFRNLCTSRSYSTLFKLKTIIFKILVFFSSTPKLIVEGLLWKELAAHDGDR